MIIKFRLKNISNTSRSPVITVAAYVESDPEQKEIANYTMDFLDTSTMLERLTKESAALSMSVSTEYNVKTKVIEALADFSIDTTKVVSGKQGIGGV